MSEALFADRIKKEIEEVLDGLILDIELEKLK